MNQQQLKKNIDLLEKYVESLEKENQAKNVQTALLYQKISELKQENNDLREQFNGLKIVYEQRTKDELEHLQKIQTLKLHNSELEKKLDQIQQEIGNFRNLQSFKSENELLQKKLQEKCTQIESLQSSNKQLVKLMTKLEKDLQSLTSKIEQIQQRKKKYAKRIKQLEQTNNELKQALESTNNYSQHSFTKIDLDKLVKDNNTLIEKVRLLQKEKNHYYQELKSISPLRQRRIINDESRRKTMNAKTQHWSQMQEKINVLKSQNEQLKANLIIR